MLKVMAVFLVNKQKKKKKKKKIYSLRGTEKPFSDTFLKKLEVKHSKNGAVSNKIVMLF